MLSADGQILLFISNRPLNEEEKATDYNIWQATWSNQAWKNIHPLPETINSNADELGPELHNGILYFSSARSGKLSFYQATQVNGDFRVTSYDSIQHDALSQSDLSFSPDGNIAVFWQLSANKKDTVLMMQRRLKEKGKWSTPIAMPEFLQSTAYEITPQFSPDGQWLYLASARKNKDYEKLNIHRFSSEKVFPESWYRQYLATKNLSILESTSTLQSIKSIEYHLEIKRENTISNEQVQLSFSPFEIKKIKDNVTFWSDGKTGYKKKANTNKQTLSKAEIDKLVHSVRYHFIYMFKQSSTKLFAQYSTKAEQGLLYRIQAKGLASFSVLLSDDKSKIMQLRYDDLAVGYESDYKLINGIWWPMRFSFTVDELLITQGEFSNFKISKT
jgi:hypothetical protein